MQSKHFLLIAEDDPDDQLLFQDAIEVACPQDIETRFVWDGVELLDVLRGMTDANSQPDLVVLDLNMPRKDGRTALQEIKADAGLAGIPVVVLTTSSFDADINFCQHYRVAGFYRKPSSISELQEIFIKLCTDYFN